MSQRYWEPVLGQVATRAQSLVMGDARLSVAQIAQHVWEWEVFLRGVRVSAGTCSDASSARSAAEAAAAGRRAP